MTNWKEFYADLIASGVECSGYCNDLYVPINEATRGIMKRYPDIYRTTFTSSITKKLMYDLPAVARGYWQALEQSQSCSSV